MIGTVKNNEQNIDTSLNIISKNNILQIYTTFKYDNNNNYYNCYTNIKCTLNDSELNSDEKYALGYRCAVVNLVKK